MALEVETEFFESRRASLLETHAGQFALVSGREVIGTYTTEAEAYEAGLARVGNKPFLIHQIRREEPAFEAPVLFLGSRLGTIS